MTPERELQATVDRETAAWDRQDAEGLVDLFHPDMVWPWPPDGNAHDPVTWVFPQGRFDRARWKAGWEELFRTHELVHNVRRTVRTPASAAAGCWSSTPDCWSTHDGSEVAAMPEAIACVTLVVRDYDEALRYFTDSLGFRLVEDTPLGEGKRWVVVAPAGAVGAALLLARAATPEQERAIGHQTGGRVGFFLHTHDFARAFEAMRARGVQFSEDPRHEAYGTVAVFADLYGNLWDLVEPKREAAGGAAR